MDSFADYLANIPSAVADEIKVAVIDDGIDGFEGTIADRIHSGMSFCRYSDVGNLTNAYFVPSGAHGTTMANLIYRVFPRVKFLVARLDEYRQPETGKRVITARSAIDVRPVLMPHLMCLLISLSRRFVGQWTREPMSYR